MRNEQTDDRKPLIRIGTALAGWNGCKPGESQESSSLFFVCYFFSGTHLTVKNATYKCMQCKLSLNYSLCFRVLCGINFPRLKIHLCSVKRAFIFKKKTNNNYGIDLSHYWTYSKQLSGKFTAKFLKSSFTQNCLQYWRNIHSKSFFLFNVFNNVPLDAMPWNHVISQ